MKSKKNMSMKDIAQLCNVSVATVSRVINQNGRFSKETEKRVLDTISEFDYETNMIARSLRIQKTESIGVLVPHIKNEFFASLVLNIENYFFDKGYSVFICNTNSEEKKERRYLKSLDAKEVDGIIYISGNTNISFAMLKRNIPIVCIDRAPYKVKSTAIIESDNYLGGFLATEKLVEKKCEKILVLNTNKEISSVQSRFKGYLAALKEYNVPVQKKLILDIGYSSFEKVKNNISELIQEGTFFDGIFATNDWLALGALHALKKHRVEVPNKVKIIGFDNTSLSKYSYPSITTINQDTKKMGTEASKCLLSFMENEKKRGPVHIVLPVQLIERETTQTQYFN